MQQGLKTAITVPLKVMHCANSCWDTMVEMAEVGNIGTISDMQVKTNSFFIAKNYLIQMKERDS